MKAERAKQRGEVKPTKIVSVENISVLSFGYTMPELRLKHAALTKVGFEVISHSEFQTVRTLICTETQEFDFFLIGPTVPEVERRTLTDLYRVHHPRGYVIFFYRGSIRNGEYATALLHERGSPENLLNAIRVLIEERND